MSRSVCSAACLAIFACGGARLDGAQVVTPEGEPKGRQGRVYFPVECKNQIRGASAPPPIQVVRLTLADGRAAIIERRLGYDSVLVSNAFDSGPDRIFQYVSDDGSGQRLLHSMSFPRSGAKAQLTVADIYQLETRAGGFRGRPARVTLRCTLQATAT